MSAVAEAFLADFDYEASSTRRVLERVPDDRLDWRPHPRSTPMGQLAFHIATLPSFAGNVVRTDSLDVMAAPRRTPPASREELLAVFEQERKDARSALSSVSDSRLTQPWTLVAGGQTLFTMPRIDALRRFMLHHIIHHRAQLGVYLRLNDIPVPGVYGPSADEA